MDLRSLALQSFPEPPAARATVEPPVVMDADLPPLESFGPILETVPPVAPPRPPRAALAMMLAGATLATTAAWHAGRTAPRSPPARDGIAQRSAAVTWALLARGLPLDAARALAPASPGEACPPVFQPAAPPEMAPAEPAPPPAVRPRRAPQPRWRPRPEGKRAPEPPAGSDSPEPLPAAPEPPRTPSLAEAIAAAVGEKLPPPAEPPPANPPPPAEPPPPQP